MFAGVAQAITASLDLDTVLRRITDSAKEPVGSDLAMIGFREGDTEAVTVRHRVGSRYTSDRTFRIEPGKGFGGQALLSGRPLRTDDYTNDPPSSKDYSALSSGTTVSAPMVVPIKSEITWSGLLCGESHEAPVQRSRRGDLAATRRRGGRRDPKRPALRERARE